MMPKNKGKEEELDEHTWRMLQEDDLEAQQWWDTREKEIRQLQQIMIEDRGE